MNTDTLTNQSMDYYHHIADLEDTLEVERFTAEQDALLEAYADQLSALGWLKRAEQEYRDAQARVKATTARLQSLRQVAA